MWNNPWATRRNNVVSFIFRLGFVCFYFCGFYCLGQLEEWFSLCIREGNTFFLKTSQVPSQRKSSLWSILLKWFILMLYFNMKLVENLIYTLDWYFSCDKNGLKYFSYRKFELVMNFKLSQISFNIQSW